MNEPFRRPVSDAKFARFTGLTTEAARSLATLEFVELGGDGFCAAYLPVYREPFFPDLSRKVRENPARYPQCADLLPDYAQVTCPVPHSTIPPPSLDVFVAPQ